MLTISRGQLLESVALDKMAMWFEWPIDLHLIVGASISLPTKSFMTKSQNIFGRWDLQNSYYVYIDKESSRKMDYCKVNYLHAM